MRTAIKFLRWGLYQSAKLDFSFRTDDGLDFVSMPGNWSSLATYIQNYRDPGIQRFIRGKVAPESTFVDVGANIGTYTVFAGAVVGPKGKVIAIEPHPLIFEYLKRNIVGNHLQNVLAVEAAVGAQRKNALVQYSKQNPGETHIASQFDTEATSVAMVRLDDVLPDLGIDNVDYLKIDVEGYELYVLQGGARTIDANRNVIIQTESFPRMPKGTDALWHALPNFCFRRGSCPTGLIARAHLMRSATTGWAVCATCCGPVMSCGNAGARGVGSGRRRANPSFPAKHGAQCSLFASWAAMIKLGTVAGVAQW